MPYSLLDSMHVVYEDCVDFCRSKEQPPFVHPIATIGRWLQLAKQEGWEPIQPDVWQHEGGEDFFK